MVAKTAQQLLEEDKIKYPREEIYKYYVEENHSKKELYEHYDISEQRIQNLLKEYNIRKGHKSGYLKARQTLKERYGSETYNNREKYKETCKSIYGVENAFQSEELKQKSRETCINRYGCEYAIQNDEVKRTAVNNHDYDKGAETLKKNFVEKYGVEYPSQLQSVIDKARATSEEKYGGIGFASESVNKKIMQTTMDRYGVPYYCMTDDCRSASSNNSAPNEEFANLLDDNNISYEREFGLHKYSYDFRVGNILIEIDPAATHNSTWHPFRDKAIDKSYHYNKSLCAKENGYRCIHIYDWDDKNKIISILKKRERIYARNCDIREVDKEDRKRFIDKYHLQGYAKDEFGIGLYYKDELVSIMTFGKPRYNKNYDYELIRYCSSKQIVGGAEKIFNKFIKDHKDVSVISYCDENKFEGSVYKNLGFKYDGVKISCHWYNMKTKEHILDSLLRQRGADQLLGTDYGKGTSNEDIMVLNGFVKVFDAGQAKYSY